MTECEHNRACRMSYGDEGCKPPCDLGLPCHLYERKVDRDALLALAEELDKDADNIISAARNARFTGGRPRMGEAKHDAYEWRCIARLIREALGVPDERTTNSTTC